MCFKIRRVFEKHNEYSPIKKVVNISLLDFARTLSEFK